MVGDDDSTVGFGDQEKIDYIEQLEYAVGGNWRPLENAQAFQCDLGYGLCTVVVEFTGDKWVGKLSSVNPPVEESTTPRDRLAPVLDDLCDLIRDHGLRIQHRGEELIDLASKAGGE